MSDVIMALYLNYLCPNERYTTYRSGKYKGVFKYPIGLLHYSEQGWDEDTFRQGKRDDIEWLISVVNGEWDYKQDTGWSKR